MMKAATQAGKKDAEDKRQGNFTEMTSDWCAKNRSPVNFYIYWVALQHLSRALTHFYIVSHPYINPHYIANEYGNLFANYI